MTRPARPVTVLVVEDDPEDRILTELACGVAPLVADFRWVRDGEELLDYLRRGGKYAGAAEAPRPGLILLDLNLPKLDGRDALRMVKADVALRSIPVVVLTTSNAVEDIHHVYQAGGNSFFTKPPSFAGLVELMRLLRRYWLETVLLPPETAADSQEGTLRCR
jgi:CheY-like chemotaxis protein